MGLATFKSIIKLWLGFSPAKIGIFSAGNGPSIRSALIASSERIVGYEQDISCGRRDKGM